MLVLHVGAEGVSGAVDLTALGAGARVRGAHAHHVQLARHCKRVYFVKLKSSIGCTLRQEESIRVEELVKRERAQDTGRNSRFGFPA